MISKFSVKRKTSDTNIDNKMFTWDSNMSRVALNAVGVAVVVAVEPVGVGDRKGGKVAARARDMENGELNIRCDFCDEQCGDDLVIGLLLRKDHNSKNPRKQFYILEFSTIFSK